MNRHGKKERLTSVPILCREVTRVTLVSVEVFCVTSDIGICDQQPLGQLKLVCTEWVLGGLDQKLQLHKLMLNHS